MHAALLKYKVAPVTHQWGLRKSNSWMCVMNFLPKTVFCVWYFPLLHRTICAVLKLSYSFCLTLHQKQSTSFGCKIRTAITLVFYLIPGLCVWWHIQTDKVAYSSKCGKEGWCSFFSALHALHDQQKGNTVRLKFCFCRQQIWCQLIINKEQLCRISRCHFYIAPFQKWAVL